MIYYVISVSALAAAVILLRAFFRKTVPQRFIYALWLLVLLRICLPVSLFDIEIEVERPVNETPSFTEKEEGDAAQDRIPADDTVSHTPPVSVPDVPITEPAPSVPVTDTPKIHIEARTLIYAAWGTGTVLCALFFVISSAVLKIKLKKSRRFCFGERGVRVYVSDAVKTPFLYGIIPCIYLTPEVADGENGRYALMHEMTHMYHADHIWSAVRLAVLSLFWWNPLIWAAALLSKRDSELACDESVAKKLDDRERIEYARLIVDTISQKPSFAVGFASAPIKERLIRLTRANKTRWVCVLLCAIVVCGSLAASFTTLRAVEIIPKEPPENEADINDEPEKAVTYEKIHRALLSDEARRMYDFIEPVVLAHDCVHLSLSYAEAGLCDDAYEALMLDNPEVNIISYMNAPELEDGKVTWMLCAVESMVDGMHAFEYIGELSFKTEEIVSSMPELSTYEKYKWLADYLCDNTTNVASRRSNAYSHAGGALMSGECALYAYAQAYQMLCAEAGLWCTTLNLEDTGSGTRTINLIKLDDGSTYYMDTAYADFENSRDKYYFTTESDALYTGRVKEAALIATGK